MEEGLDWDHVDYADNSTCLNLMVGKPTGLILLLDEECRYIVLSCSANYIVILFELLRLSLKELEMLKNVYKCFGVFSA